MNKTLVGAGVGMLIGSTITNLFTPRTIDAFDIHYISLALGLIMSGLRE